MAERKFPIDFNERTAVKTTDVLLINNIDNGEDEFAIVENVGKALDAANSTINGVKTYAVSPIIPDADADNEPASKGQMDTAIAAESTARTQADGLKADKVTVVTTGNFAGLDAQGNLTDSGKKATDFEPADATILKEADIANNLSETGAGKVLDATQGKLLNDELAYVENEFERLEQESIDRTFKTMRIGASGLTTLSPTTQYFTYRLNVINNIVLNIDLQRMIEQVGNARCRLIIDMPVKKTITITNPFLWGGTASTFDTAGQYVLEVIDVDGSGTPLVWLVASTTKAQTTGVILYVDSAGADYSVGQINEEVATRATSSWANPFKYLQNAINASTAGDIIFVKSGTYYPTHLRTTPTSYTDGDHLLRDATFSQKAGVDVYGGFLGTESKTWERVVDENGYPVNPTILCGDILNEAEIDPAKTVGDPRTNLSKANAAYNVVYANVASYTYLNGVEVKYGFANGAISPTDRGSGVSTPNTNLVILSCTITGNTATSGGGTFSGTVTNCTITGNTAATNGGGTYGGTVTNCTITGNTAAYGGGTSSSAVTNCTITGNTAANDGGGTYGGTVTNCTITGNTAASSGGGTFSSTVTNCTITNNKGLNAIFTATTTDTHYNNLVFGNKNASGNTVGYDNKAATGVKIFRNNAYDTAHPTITGGAGSDIDTTTCIQNLTLEQAGIIALSFVGVPATPEQWVELNAYISEAKARPTGVNLLKAAGINSATYPAPATDITGAARPLTPNSVTIGAYESE